MAGKKTTATPGQRHHTTKVNDFMADLDHPLKPEIEAVRTILRGADPRIQESIKWNAPSFSLEDYFATLKLRPFGTVQVVFHTGAKVKAMPTAMVIDDPAGLLHWAAPDRAVATFSDMHDITAKQTALVAIIHQWLAQM